MKDSIDKLQLTTWIVMVGMFYLIVKTNNTVLFIGIRWDELSPNDWVLYMQILTYFSICNIIFHNKISRVITLLSIPIIFILLTNALKYLWISWFLNFPYTTLYQVCFCLGCYIILMTHIYSLGFKANLLLFFSILLVIGLVPISKQFAFQILANSKIL